MTRLLTLSETFDTEIKRWLDPTNPTHAVIIAKGCIALRNNNGGQMILGFDDKSLQKDINNVPADVKTAYHVDVIQRIVAKYALPKFDIEVVFEEKDRQTHPIILVKSGVDSPVMTKSGVENELRQNTIYVRTLSNNTVSSSEPKIAADWDRLIRICFDNREADIGRFFRRHIKAISDEMKSVSTVSMATQLIQEGKGEFEERLKEKMEAGSLNSSPNHGFREAAVVIGGKFERIPLVDLLNTLFIRQPKLTGWPAWVDSRSFYNTAFRPYPKKKAWEAFVTERDYGFGVKAHDFTFWRIESGGRFYQLRTLDDDSAKSFGGKIHDPGTVLDYVLLVGRTVEIIVTAKAFAESLVSDPRDATLDLAFRWSGLRGRRICSWAESGYDISGIPAEDDEVLSTCTMSVDLPQSELWSIVKAVTTPVFEAFGSGKDDSFFERLTKKVLNRWDRNM